MRVTAGVVGGEDGEGLVEYEMDMVHVTGQWYLAERRGEERRGQEWRGEERTGEDRSGEERRGVDRRGQEWRG